MKNEHKRIGRREAFLHLRGERNDLLNFQQKITKTISNLDSFRSQISVIMPISAIFLAVRCSSSRTAPILRSSRSVLERRGSETGMTLGRTFSSCLIRSPVGQSLLLRNNIISGASPVASQMAGLKGVRFFSKMSDDDLRRRLDDFQGEIH